MNLFEGEVATDEELWSVVPDVFRNAITIAELREAYGHLSGGHSLDGVRKYYARTEKSWALEDLAEAFAIMKEECRGDYFPLYRTMNIDLENPRLNPRDLGRYWSYSEAYTIGEEGHYDEDTGETTVMFEARVALDGVDWGETLPLVLDGVEHEIRIKENARMLSLTSSHFDLEPVTRN